MAQHKLLISFIKKDKDIQNKTLIEIGCTREATSAQDSTKSFYDLSTKLGFNFITVDMDPENIKNVKSRLKNINAVCSKGEDFLKGYDGNIDYLYLDAFDFYHPRHSKKRKDSYKTNLGCEITKDDSLCHKMHLDCCIYSVDKMPNKSIIVIDDVISDRQGKGVTAIPFLLKNNFNLIASNCAFQKD